MTDVNPRDALAIKRIVRVNHAGEYGAIRIYAAQIAVARQLFPDIAPALRQMRADEIDHCAKFFAAMPARNSRPCRVMQLWSLGGVVLGVATALAGRRTIWICTAAVEETVHRHLDDQLRFLEGRDPELHAVILGIRAEELEHLRHAEAHLEGATPGAFERSLRAGVRMVTESLIWLSTWGDSSRMSRTLRETR